MFVDAGGNINAKDANGRTCLHQYIIHERPRMDLSSSFISVLLECGVDPKITDSYGKTALDYLLTQVSIANVPELPNIVKLFASNGCKSSHPSFMEYLSLPLVPVRKSKPKSNRFEKEEEYQKEDQRKWKQETSSNSSLGKIKAANMASTLSSNLNSFLSVFTNHVRQNQDSE